MYCFLLQTRKELLEVDPRLADGYVIDKAAIAANEDVALLATEGIKLTVYEVCSSTRRSGDTQLNDMSIYFFDWQMGPNRVARKKPNVLYFDVSLGPIGSLVCTIPAVFAKGNSSASFWTSFTLALGLFVMFDLL